MNLSGLGSLGLGTALNTGLNVGLNTGNTFADYQTKRATEESAQVATNEANMQKFINSHADRMYVSSLIPHLAQKLAEAPADAVKGQDYQAQALALARQQQQQAQGNMGATVPAQTQANPQIAQVNPNPQPTLQPVLQQQPQTLQGMVSQPQGYVPPVGAAMTPEQLSMALYGNRANVMRGLQGGGYDYSQ